MFIKAKPPRATTGMSGVALEEAERFRQEASEEVDREQKILDKVNQPRKGFTVGWIIAFIILGISVYILFLNEIGFLFWILMAFILYGFNFVIWFLPTSRNKADKAEKEKLKLSGKSVKGPVRYILKKKKGLGVEIGLTMFLSGMVPLALSFFVLFGIGIIFGVYFAFARNLYDHNQALSVLVQIFVILAFFVALIILKPQERGFAQTARKLKGRYGSAQGRGRIMAIFIMAVVGIFLAALGLMFIGAILAPGGTWHELLSLMQEKGYYNTSILLLVFIAEVILMRHFQAVSGKRMANRLLTNRIDMIKEGTLRPLDGALSTASASKSPSIEQKVFEDAKTNFYSIVIYDIFEHNFFGYSPVYVVGPRISYVLNEDALAHVR